VPTVREIGPEETAVAYRAMRELRPHFATQESFVAQADEQRGAGYRLVGAWADGADWPGAVAGFRMGLNLPWGHHLYVDDLSTHPEARNSGLAGALLDWLDDEARRAGCGQVHLDSGVGPERMDAHRLYLAKRFRISAHHFQKEL
jgi:GNAT superfamily N-acetyltransferase